MVVYRDFFYVFIMYEVYSVKLFYYYKELMDPLTHGLLKNVPNCLETC